MKKALILFISIISACTQPEKNLAVTKPLAVNTAKKQKADTTQLFATYTPEYPADTIYPGRILIEGIFHEDEVEKKDAQRNWIGLFKTDSSYYLAPFKIKLSRVKDDIVDTAKGQHTGWEVKTGSQDTSVLLIAGANYLKQRNILSLIKQDTTLAVGKTTLIRCGGITYQLYVPGEKQGGLITNYKIFIKAVVNGKNYNQLLVSAQQSDYEMSVTFAGDIDGDGIPDLIINTSNNENILRPTLYLSKPAAKGDLLKVVGLHTIVGC